MVDLRPKGRGFEPPPPPPQSVTASFPWARHINPNLVLVQPRKTRPVKDCWLGRKESNQTNKHCLAIVLQPNLVNLGLDALFRIISSLNHMELDISHILPQNDYKQGFYIKHKLCAHIRKVSGRRTNSQHISQCMKFPTIWYVRPVWSEPLIVAWVFYEWGPQGFGDLGRMAFYFQGSGEPW